MFSHTTKKQLTATSLIVAAVVAMPVTAIALAGPGSGHLDVRGSFAGSPPSGGPDCPSPVGICATADFRGSIRGPATAVVQSVSPTSEPNVVTGVADIVIHDPRGDLRCTEIIVLNSSAGGDAEEGWICEITGGTGRFAGVSGHLEAFGSAAGGGDVQGRYGGRLTFP